MPLEVYTEEDWNEESTIKTAPYNYSKTSAEKWAWDFVKSLPDSEKIELETINPALSTTPSHILAHTNTYSHEHIHFHANASWRFTR